MSQLARSQVVGPDPAAGFCSTAAQGQNEALQGALQAEGWAGRVLVPKQDLQASQAWDAAQEPWLPRWAPGPPPAGESGSASVQVLAGTLQGALQAVGDAGWESAAEQEPWRAAGQPSALALPLPERTMMGLQAAWSAARLQERSTHLLHGSLGRSNRGWHLRHDAQV